MNRRILFTLAAVLSLLLSVATVALWVRSYARFTSWRITGRTLRVSVQSAEGRLVVGWFRPPAGKVFTRPRWEWSSENRTNVLTPFPYFGFDREKDGLNDSSVLWFPHAVVVAVTCLLPVTWLRRRLKRRPKNQCIQCGYNLTANTSGTCPECGAAIRREGVITALAIAARKIEGD